jgi:hypothetical protein
MSAPTPRVPKPHPRLNVVACPASWGRALAVGGVFWAALATLSWVPKHSGNVWSRYMTIESIVERGELTIDRSPARTWTPDIMKAAGHYYSEKPPVLSVLSSLVYLPLYFSGWRLTRSAEDFRVVNWVMVTTVVGSTSCLTIAALRRLLQAAPLPALAADALALLFGFGSLLLTYGVTFNNHTVAAAAIMSALALTTFEPLGPASRRRFLVGLLAALALVVDIPAGGAMFVALFAWLCARSRRLPWSFLAGSVGPLLLHSVVQTAISGSPLPAEMQFDLIAFPGSYWASREGRWTEPGPRWQFALELLLGPQGWLTVTPALAFGVVGLVRSAFRRDDPLRPLALVVGSVLLVMVGYYVWGVRRTDYAGQSFGVRHLLAISPAVYLFAVVLLARLQSRVAWLAFGFLLAAGMVFSMAGMLDPWSRVDRRDDSGLAIVKRLTLYRFSTYRR